MNKTVISALAVASVGCAAAFAEIVSSSGTGTVPGGISVVSGSAGTPVAAATPAPLDENRFNAAWYLQQNPDVARAGMDAWDHYNRYGRWEGRRAYAGAPTWHPDPSASPATYATAPGCDIEVATPWAPAGAKQVRIRFKLTRFRDGTPCERSYAITGGASYPTTPAAIGGFTPINIGAQSQVMAVGEVLSLPSQGSQGELIVNIPNNMASQQPGYFHVWMRSAEYNPIAGTGFDVYVGGTQPAGSQYQSNPLVLPATADYPTLGQPTYSTSFQGDLAADGWTFSAGVQLNGMSGVFTAPSWRTASGKPTNNYQLVTDAKGEQPLALVLRDQRSDPVAGKSFSAPMISRLLGNGGYGFRRTVQTLPKPIPGTDAGAPWGIRHGGGWPPEFDTHEGFVGDPRVYQTIHMPNGSMIGFTPRVDITGKHEWMEEFGRQTYRLWIDHKLIVERPNYLAGEVLDTTFSIEGPGGAGGAADLSQPYDGLSLLLYGLAWWQR